MIPHHFAPVAECLPEEASRARFADERRKNSRERHRGAQDSQSYGFRATKFLQRNVRARRSAVVVGIPFPVHRAPDNNDNRGAK